MTAKGSFESIFVGIALVVAAALMLAGPAEAGHAAQMSEASQQPDANEDTSQDDQTAPVNDAEAPGFEVLSPSEGEELSVLPLAPVPGVAETPQENVEDEGDQNFAPLSTLAPLGAFAPPDEGAPDGTPEALTYREVTVRALDKVTARTQDIVVPIGETVRFKTIDITMRTCNKRPPEEPPETTAFLEIMDHKIDDEPINVFSGWMFALSPGLNALEHPVYDVWVIDCKISTPVQDVGIE